MKPATLKGDFNHLEYTQKRLVRVGYIRLNGKAVSELEYQALTTPELQKYFDYGRKVELRSQRISLSIGGVVAVVVAIIFGIHFFHARKETALLNEHYNSVAPVDVCTGSIQALQLFASDIGLNDVLPANPTTKYASNQSSSCNYYIEGSGTGYTYRDFVTATVSKTKTKQVDNTHTVDASLLTDTPYDVYSFNGSINYYSISVDGGIDPKDSPAMDKTQRDDLSKLIVLLVGTGIAKDIPQNASVTDVN